MPAILDAIDADLRALADEYATRPARTSDVWWDVWRMHVDRALDDRLRVMHGEVAPTARIKRASVVS